MLTKSNNSANLDILISLVMFGLSIWAGFYEMKKMTGEHSYLHGLLFSVAGLVATTFFLLARTRSIIENIGEQVNIVVKLDHKAIKRNNLLAESLDKQCELLDGLDVARHTYIHSLILGRLPKFIIPVSDHKELIVKFTDIVNCATSYVCACTYAVPLYLHDFWQELGGDVTSYYQAHKEAIQRKVPEVRRIFIVPDAYYDEGIWAMHMPLLEMIIEHHRDQACMNEGK